jgi:hypothetical protein
LPARLDIDGADCHFIGFFELPIVQRFDEIGSDRGSL